MNQLNIFDCLYPRLKIDKPIRLIELFAGYGSQSMALRNLGVDFEHYKVVEFDKYAIDSYNAIHNTNFETQDITKIDSKWFEIKETDKYCYVMTWSYPCQALSKAGKREGMVEGSGTTSSLGWNVIRKLQHMNELPQVLLMENVPDVHSAKNIKEFQKMQLELENLGYKNYIQDLSAKNYGIPQNRNRCFMVSVIGDYSYKFPKTIDLKLRLKDMLEDEVDEKYYLNEKQLKQIIGWNAQQCPLENAKEVKDDVIQCITDKSNTSMNASMLLIKEPICLNSKVNGKQPSLQDRIYDSESISTAITTSFLPNVAIENKTGGVIIPEATKKGYAIANDGDGIYIDQPHQKRGVVQKEMIPTIKTSCDDVAVVIADGMYLGASEKFKRPPLKNVSRCLKSSNHDAGVVIGIETNENNNEMYTYTDSFGRGVLVVNGIHYFIRKLTPRECGRLMGVSDEDISKMLEVNSNLQCYKQFGNSIVVNVLEAIFREMF